MEKIKYSATVKNGLKYTIKRNVKKIVQNFKMPEKELSGYLKRYSKLVTSASQGAGFEK